jgi:mercuric ion transport protein
MRSGWKPHILMLPGVGFALLPKLACPMCWPLYASVLTSVGLGFLLSTAYLLPLTAAFLLIAVAALAYRAKDRRGYAPFLFGLGASLAVLAGKFHMESEPLLYGGVAVLVGSSVWNVWPRKRSVGCPKCSTTETT